MKFKKLLFLLPALSVIITSCSSDDQTPGSVVEPPVVVAPVPQKLFSFTPAYNLNIGISRYIESYEYDDKNRIVKINEGGPVFGVTYISEDLIEINQLSDVATGFKINSKRLIYLKDGRIELMVHNENYLSDITNQTKYVSADSTLFTYKNNYLSKVEMYRKTDYNPTYELSTKVEFEEHNGNIIKAHLVSMFEPMSYTVNYTYDTEPYVNGIDHIYQTPLQFSYYMLRGVLYDKIGKKSTNNIVKIDCDYHFQPVNHGISLKTMTIKRNLDSEKRLKELLFSGTSFDNENNLLEFKDATATFTYK
ncbi:hypothetical protein [Flavobacterium hercynium]|uniref:DUF4595 domain-containing protein n=1 Tax=Flavobacterium hercynium TaxID=387094 RepID=A0A226GMN0_9FLAO|nr:hypothetical protein [Flavobacterium hercynium]OXA83292.1 hypothetical protein B0A66_22400 [Flavobacterium hercynium]PAM95269.1 hypothetical protein B4N84_08325 [Flavobacterium sp. IR1]SMP37525.1 hypothetical protein SAMN06265346_1362 [Flavobacterium hercynium]